MKFFDDYVRDYDMNNPDINYKYYHSYRVMDAMELLGDKLNLSAKDVYLAKVIGLLHDIGRFEQEKLYNSYEDKEMDHGDYGVKVLKENDFLKYTNIDKEDYEVVYKSIKNHNKFAVDNDLNERELLFAKLIRDADKLDILYALGSSKILVLKQDEEQISKELEEEFFNNNKGNIEYVKNKNDELAVAFCYIYDIYFKDTYKIIYKNNYYGKIYERINRKDIFKPYIEYLNKYIEERID